MNSGAVQRRGINANYLFGKRTMEAEALEVDLEEEVEEEVDMKSPPRTPEIAPTPI